MVLKHGAGLATWELALTKKLVHEHLRHSRRPGRAEFEDLVQDCLLHWIEVRAKLESDPLAPPLAYMAQVLRHKLTDTVRARSSAKRCAPQHILSLDALVEGPDGAVTWAQWLAQCRAEGFGSAHRFGHIEVRIDLQRAMQSLTPLQRSLCVLLGEEGLSLTQAAQRLRRSRGSLYPEIDRIKKILKDYEFANYFTK